eukprot:scaffold2769_cov156-Amphora_coffeaeformis.AAC.5
MANSPDDSILDYFFVTDRVDQFVHLEFTWLNLLYLKNPTDFDKVRQKLNLTNIAALGVHPWASIFCSIQF